MLHISFAAMHPVQWVRLDPGGERLCSGRVLQVERTLRNQLFESKDVIAQIEAVRVRFKSVKIISHKIKLSHNPFAPDIINF